MIVLAPCKKPPKQSDIRAWLQQKLKEENTRREKVRNVKHQSTELKSPKGPGNEEIKTPIKSPTLRIPEGLVKRANSVSKQRDYSIINSPTFSPTIASSDLMADKSPLSSTPMITKRKAPFRLPITPGIVDKSVAKVCQLLRLLSARCIKD